MPYRGRCARLSHTRCEEVSVVSVSSRCKSVTLYRGGCRSAPNAKGHGRIPDARAPRVGSSVLGKRKGKAKGQEGKAQKGKITKREKWKRVVSTSCHAGIRHAHGAVEYRKIYLIFPFRFDASFLLRVPRETWKNTPQHRSIQHALPAARPAAES